MATHPPAELLQLREQIDTLDQHLLKLLGERQAIVDRVIVLKAKTGLPARLPDRVTEVITTARNSALQHGVSPDLAEKIWSTMVEWFIAHEEKRLGQEILSS